MRIKAVSGLSLAVIDPIKSANFYENLGFTVVDKSPELSIVRSNWFWLELMKDSSSVSGAQRVFLSVDNVEDVKVELMALGMDSTDVQEMGKRKEVEVKDPDGHRLVLFQKVS